MHAYATQLVKYPTLDIDIGSGHDLRVIGCGARLRFPLSLSLCPFFPCSLAQKHKKKQQ